MPPDPPPQGRARNGRPHFHQQLQDQRPPEQSSSPGPRHRGRLEWSQSRVGVEVHHWLEGNQQLQGRNSSVSECTVEKQRHQVVIVTNSSRLLSYCIADGCLAGLVAVKQSGRWSEGCGCLNSAPQRAVDTESSLWKDMEQHYSITDTQ